MLKAIALLFLILAFPITISFADDATSINAKLKRLAEFENLKQTIQHQKESCINNMKDFDPNVVIKTQPNIFGGIMPGTKYWNRVEAAFKKYVSSYCNSLNEDEAFERFVTIYGPLFTQETLDSILNFYESPSGRKYLEITSVGKIKLQDSYYQIYAEKMKIALKEYYDELQDIYNAREN